MKTIRFTVYCFNRYLVIDVPNQDEDRAYNILQERYNEWNGDDFQDAGGDWCCEEYMLAGLAEMGIVYIEKKPVLTSERLKAIEAAVKKKYGDSRSYHILGAALTEVEVFFNVCMAMDDEEAVNDVMAWYDA